MFKFTLFLASLKIIGFFPFSWFWVFFPFILEFVIYLYLFLTIPDEN